ncbi:MAG: hypothetical protein JWO68_331 [Actinomycetia bacterium]|nr:hypothetical protein [Actinomycetes bacterium]
MNRPQRALTVLGVAACALCCGVPALAAGVVAAPVALVATTVRRRRP